MATEIRYFIPTRHDVASMRVGQMAIDCFGKLAEVTEITAIREDVNGRLFCCYYTRTTPTGSCSMSVKEGELTRTVHLSCRHTSAETDRIEREMLARGASLEIR